VAEGYQILTRPEFAPYLERFDNVPKSSRLSGPALEALAIIAYRQPIGRLEVEYIRGVGSSGVIRTLQDYRMVEVVGRAEGLGRPLLYGTTSHFLEHFGFTSLEDLPRPEELPIVLRERIPLEEGEGAEADEAEGSEDDAQPGDEGAEADASGAEADAGAAADGVTVDAAVAEALSEEEGAGEAPAGDGVDAEDAGGTEEASQADADDEPEAATDEADADDEARAETG
jgi:segregation and condensation protein B